jgi:hypothetical protein
VRTVKKDLKAVESAVTERWSNGPVAGQINRLEALKRQMYGRAGVELLRTRVLPQPVVEICFGRPAGSEIAEWSGHCEQRRYGLTTSEGQGAQADRAESPRAGSGRLGLAEASGVPDDADGFGAETRR